MALVEAGPKSPDTPPARADTGAHDECRTVAADRGSRLPHGVPPLLGPGRPLPGDVGRRRRLGAGSGPPVLRRPRAQLWCLPDARAGRSPPGRGAATAVRRPRRRGRVRAAIDHRGATATREDWRELLAAAATLGATTVWVAFHGLGVDHDRQINRTGAFTETCLAVQRVHSVGLRAGANVFLTTDNTPQAERLLGVLQRLEIDQMWWGPATDYPTARGRRNERLRPALSELLPLAGRIRTLSPFDHGVWANLEAHTEAAWTRRALAGDWPPWTRHDGEVLELVCRPTSTCTPAPPAGTANGTATCAPTTPRRPSPAPSNKVGGPTRRCGSVPSRCRRLPSWPSAMATLTGSGSTSAQNQEAVRKRPW
jgi:hypothetical protein